MLECKGKNNYSLILHLYLLGYSIEQIRIITGSSRDVIASVYSGKHPTIPSEDGITEDQNRRLHIINTIVLGKFTISPFFDEQDKCYIRLLKLLNVPMDAICARYYNISQVTVKQAAYDADIDIRNFNPYLIGLTDNDYDEIVAALFSKI